MFESNSLGTIKGGNLLIDITCLFLNILNIGNFKKKSTNPFGISIFISISLDK